MDDFLPNKLHAKISNFSGGTLRSTRNSLQNYLFRSSEPGFTSEPWDITTLYQDRAGTTPVTAAGQSVGLRLDKSKGLALGSELVTNGTFDSDTGWTKGAGWTIIIGNASATAVSAGTALTQAITTQVGKTYQITYAVTVVSGSVSAFSAVSGAGSIKSTSGSYTEVFVAAGTSTLVGVQGRVSAFTGSIDNISVRELAGTHEVAINDAARGIYGWMPKTGRRNLLTYSEQFDNAAWTKPSSTITPNADVAPDGSSTADQINNTGASIVSSPAVTLAAGISAVFYVWLRSATGSDQTVNLSIAGAVNTAFTVTSVWQRFSVVWPSPSAGSFNGRIGTTGQAYNVYAWGAQLELGSTATAYQRVVSNYDITEAGIPSCYYVLANGVNTAYVTPTITPGTDKVQVFAGVRKLNDPGSFAAVIVESSVQADANNGAFFLIGRDNFTPAFYEFGTRGTTFRLAGTNNPTFAAPITNVITGLGDISGDRATLRVNGTQVAQSTADQGTGNYLAYPAYIYARGGTTLPFNGYDFGHVVRFGPNLDAATIARVESLIARNTPEVTL